MVASRAGGGREMRGSQLTRKTEVVAVSSTDPCGVGSAAIIRLVRLLKKFRDVAVTS